MSQLNAATEKKGAGADRLRVRPLALKRIEGRIDLAAVTGSKHLKLHAHRPSRLLQVFHRSLASWTNSGVDEHGDTSSAGHQLTQERQTFCRQLCIEKTDSCEVAFRSRQVRDKSEPD